MKNSLGHLPQHKQDELALIRDIILEQILDVRTIILFGSYARGNWVEDTHIEDNATHVYQSDFDILVTTKNKEQAENSQLHYQIEQAIRATGKVDTPISIIYHTFSELKEQIAQGHYFFADIKKEGKSLYSKKDRYKLSKIEMLLPQQRKQTAQEHFDYWFKKAKGFYKNYEFNFRENENNLAAFMLHQTTESLYGAITLVFVNYRYRTHDIELLSHKAISYDENFAAAFPMNTKQQRNDFKLLKHAYIDARYKKDYEITKEQLQYLADRVQVLMNLTQTICTQKIEGFNE